MSVTLGAFHWCYDARGHQEVWRHFRKCRWAAIQAPWSWAKRK